ncbi:hypothetical protein HF319_16955, partial [Xanthomonas sp. Kuri4-1]
AEALLADIRGLSLDGPDGPVRITATLGVHSAVPDGPASEREFFEQADAALYRAKAAGRNGYAGSGAAARIHTPANGRLFPSSSRSRP